MGLPETKRNSILKAARYKEVSEDKATGSTYTPKDLADFLADQMLQIARLDASGRPLVVLDPAVGEGELLASLLPRLPKNRPVEVYGFDNDERALRTCRERLSGLHQLATLRLETQDFLAFAEAFEGGTGGLFDERRTPIFDLAIANPPYVRTQIIGAESAQALAERFGLTGRVDLYHAFVLAIASVLRPAGVAGIIVSNRFMTTKGGASVREAIRERFRLRHIWDLGDTKLFGAAVLPAVFVAEGKGNDQSTQPKFSTVYETQDEPVGHAPSVIATLTKSGVVGVPDGRRFRVQHGSLEETKGAEDVWRLASGETDTWLATIDERTWGTFREIGKVRVGVKTCADKVYIRDDWHSLPESRRPEHLRPLTTHHIGRRFRADPTLGQRQIVYTHESPGGKRRAIRIDDYPKTKAYLESHRETLEARSYVIEAGRQWYEIWVPQDPAAWALPKLVFRDISEEPCFWIDRDGTIVNGDCYWLVCEGKAGEDLLWLAASVANSKFIEKFYDHRFNNKLYAGRRRFITQYVEKFPLPDPALKTSRKIVELAKKLYETIDQPAAGETEAEINRLVHEAFGLGVEEIAR
ncbi:MAG: N-6 DNA methylase [Planctomycetes bacterium]|nr:N-6 DNA methylase [Planctomycetota bacterium]